MALLTADDVLNKDFDSTKFREGYDQDQVDEFLDEVVATLNALYAENADLRSKLAECEQRVGELTRAAGRSGGAPAPAQAPQAQAPSLNAGAPTVVATPPVQASAPQAPAAQASAPQAPAAAPQAPAPMAGAPLSADTVIGTPPAALGAQATQGPATSAVPSAQNQLVDQARQARKNEPESATQMLALAQRLHDEYVKSGQEEGERIISAAKAQAAGIVREAEEASVRTMGKLEQERSLLERKIEELRIFERDYRTRLKSYLENLLTDLEGKASASGTDYLPGTATQGGSWEQRGTQTQARQQGYRPFGG